MSFLEGVSPCFPRFIAGFLESSVVGISDGVIGLIQNSGTMRNIFKKTFSDKVFRIVVGFEMKAMNYLSKSIPMRSVLSVCGSTRADELRNDSWGVTIIGQTIPHPYEFLRFTLMSNILDHISVGCPVRIPYKEARLKVTGPVL